ncbi:RNA-binding cell elongation regulator Jag/EloR [Lachnoclostridium sp. An181]|uniref:RNA-binding cell elongation regulator Jag/EloR n=1 Tax=Lachnoclostridium sp. An181 TaxID=1965575 RepID=UPI000B39031A|nr:RNA-binding cell elongation regulator Jag/EloR [Lachnoclostridium sp. An181]OUP48808.1 RNA-binding protein [Lachnoclostridium sp. An181]
MSEITVSAKTLSDAITEALIQLGITSDQLEYDVIEKGSAGFLGIGSRQAVIRAWKKEVKEETVEEIIQKELVKPVEREIIREEKKKPVKQAEKPAVEKKAEETVVSKVEEKSKEECEKFLKDVLRAMGMDVKLTSTVDEDGALNIEMEGEHMGILIGKRGQTLDSLQYLANRVANKYQEGYVRVKLDTENYRQRRKETLENLAKNIAYKVKRTKKPVYLEPMNPYERRIIHSALQADRYVNTHSEGEEPYRRVVVTPIRK